jgi:hypothetical protein
MRAGLVQRVLQKIAITLNNREFVLPRRAQVAPRNRWDPVVWPGIGTPCQFSGGPVSVKPAFGRVVTAKIVVGLS